MFSQPPTHQRTSLGVLHPCLLRACDHTNREQDCRTIGSQPGRVCTTYLPRHWRSTQAYRTTWEGVDSVSASTMAFNKKASSPDRRHATLLEVIACFGMGYGLRTDAPRRGLMRCRFVLYLDSLPLCYSLLKSQVLQQ